MIYRWCDGHVKDDLRNGLIIKYRNRIITPIGCLRLWDFCSILWMTLT